jgi:WD repeat and SOF domain-containing protein 1
LPQKKALFQMNAHQGFVRGLAFAENRALAADSIFVSSGDDKKVQIWSLNGIKAQLSKQRTEKANTTLFKNYLPQATYLSKSGLLNIDHSYSDDIFATSGAVVQVWSYERSSPIHSFESWEVDTVTKLKFNPSETNILAAVCADRSICFYDLRGKTAL